MSDPKQQEVRLGLLLARLTVELPAIRRGQRLMERQGQRQEVR
jgi:hypothetical protein